MGGSYTYWFPAKAYGWGWGAPRTWQGWLVIALYVLGTVALIAFVDPEEETAAFLLGILLLSAALVTVCWVKGEPTKWRWGGR